ncbi:hypothetical protein Ahy_B01g055473 [Arachis hypogaea]|uniref:Ribosomal RNA-processing protein 14 N-terminal domain-containing protein n=1 Tax=Arachis hypogaea TaxID=3818 RepID=A0A445AW93_ARAHY|nr:hypothetical protein Ahy_B01g055473 [Arachis hypogaea]
MDYTPMTQEEDETDKNPSLVHQWSHHIGAGAEEDEEDQNWVMQSLIDLGALQPTGDLSSVRRSVQFFLNNLLNQTPDQAQTLSAIGELIELIPAKLFLLTDDKDKPWFQGLSKAKKAENLGKEKANESSDEEDGEAKPIALEGDNRSMTYEELRQKLHRKLEEFHSSCENSGRAKKREDRNAKRRFEDRKRKRDGEMQGKKKRKLSKHKELERAKKLEEVKNNPEKGEAVAKKQMWKAALDRASGIKVHDDDPKLLEKAFVKRRRSNRRMQRNGKREFKQGTS